MRKRHCFTWVLVLILAGLWVPERAAAQEAERYTILLQGVPLRQALQEVIRVSSIDLVYSRDLVEGKTVFCRREQVQIDEIMRCVLDDTGLDYIRSSSGTYILINEREVESQYGDLAGGVFDADTGAPLPYANVLLADATIGTTTNEDGLFSMASLVAGAYPVAISYIGYETVYDSIYVEPGRANKQRFTLQSSSINIEPIVINGLVQRVPSSLLGSGELSEEDFQSVSGFGKTPDVIQGASRLVGVASQQPVADLYIQGGGGNEHFTLLDGVAIRNPVSMGRHLGAFSPLALERLTVQKAGFEARHGSQLTGLVSVEHTLSTRHPISGAIMIDPVSVNGRFITRSVGENGRELAVMAAGRISNWDVYQDPDVRSLLDQWTAIDPLVTRFWVGQDVTVNEIRQLAGSPQVQFSDLHLAARFKASPFHIFHGSLYRAVNDLTADHAIVEGLSTGNGYAVLSSNAYSWKNWAAQLRHSWIIGTRSVLTTQLQGSWHNSALLYNVYSPEDINSIAGMLSGNVLEVFQDSLAAGVNADENNVIKELGVRFDLNHSFSTAHTMEVGIEGYHVDSRFSFFQPFVDPIRTHPANWTWAGFLQSTFTLGKNFVIVPGLRATYVPERSTVYAEPRMAIRVDGRSSLLGTYAFRLAGGLYRQYLNQFELTSYGTVNVVPTTLFWLPLDNSLSPSRSQHLAFDAMLSPAPAWTFRMEAYSKWNARLLVYDFDRAQDLENMGNAVPQDSFIAATSGEARGIGTSVSYSGKMLGAGVSYEYSEVRQRFPNRFNDATIATPWEVPHRFRLNASMKLSEQVQLESIWTHSWGRSWAFRRSYYDVFAVWNPQPSPVTLPDFSNPQHDRVPAYQRLDLNIKYRGRVGRFDSIVQFYVVNVLDDANVFDYNIEAYEDSFITTPRVLPGRQFSLVFRVNY